MAPGKMARARGELHRMAWTWRYENGEGKPAEGPTETFTSQADAESWLGQTWRRLAGLGVVTAILVEDDRVEYRMSLLPASE
jgi:hypothetical protein